MKAIFRALVLAFLLGFAAISQAQEPPINPDPAPVPALSAPTPAPTTLPGAVATPTVEPTPTPLPNLDAEAVRGFTDPNRVSPLPPIIGATPTPEPIPTATPNPQITPTPIPTEGEITGQEEPGGNFSLDAGEKDLIYDLERGLALAQGDVTFRYRGLTVKGGRGVADFNTNKATLSDNLTVTATLNGETRTFTGDSLVFDLDTQSWRLTQLGTTFAPEFFPPGTVLEPIYLRDGRVIGEGQNVRGENFKFSSCDRDHYYLRSNRLEFYRTAQGDPKRLVLRKNALYLFGRKILPLPVYAISLLAQTTRTQPIQVTAGQNATDGVFVKSFYNLRADASKTDSILADLFQKRGLGLGLQREFAAGGLLYLYALSGQTGGREINSRLSKAYQLSRLVNADVNFSSTRNNSLTGENVASQNGQFSLNRNDEQAQTTAVYNFDSSSYAGSNSRNDSIQINHNQDFGSGYSAQISGNLNKSEYGGDSASVGAGNESASGDLNVQLGKTTPKFDLYLRAETHNDLISGRTLQFERLPELLLQSGTERLQIPLLSHLVPGDFTLGYGRFNEPSFSEGSGGREDRADLFYNARERSVRLIGDDKSNSTFRAAGTFEQAFYGADAARYNYAYNLNLSNTLGKANLAFNYAKQRTFGFTPFQFDFTTPGEYLDYNLSFLQGERLRATLSGGRDLQNGFTRDLLLNAQWAPSDHYYLSLGTNYILPNDETTGRTGFGDIYGNLKITQPRGRSRLFNGQLSLGFRYSPDGRGLTRANVGLDTFLTKKARFQALVGYDGFAKRLDFEQYRLTYDLHCFNLYGTYDGSRKELRFDIALKAFPFADTRFGRNENSEGFDASVGEIR